MESFIVILERRFMHNSWERWRLAGEFRFSAFDWPASRRRSQGSRGEVARSTKMLSIAGTVYQMGNNVPSGVPVVVAGMDCGVINGVRICWPAVSVQLTLIS